MLLLADASDSRTNRCRDTGCLVSKLDQKKCRQAAPNSASFYWTFGATFESNSGSLGDTEISVTLVANVGSVMLDEWYARDVSPNVDGCLLFLDVRSID